MKVIVPDKESALSKLTPSQISELEMHSFINLMNVIVMQLQILSEDHQQSRNLDDTVTLTSKLLNEVRSGSINGLFPQRMLEYKKLVKKTLRDLEKKVLAARRPENNLPVKSDNAQMNGVVTSLEELSEAKDLLDDTLKQLDIRVEELALRLLGSEVWQETRVESLRDEYVVYLKTLEKNSRGRFRIAIDGARLNESDYLVLTDIRSDLGDVIFTTVLFKDVMRDIVSNARKYTPLGGTIRFSLHQQKDRLHLCVSDTGIGIPEDELPLVFEYGYRASNAKSIRTMGGGFGLTKALHVVRQFRGDMSIASETGNGTTISITLPIPETALT